MLWVHTMQKRRSTDFARVACAVVRVRWGRFSVTLLVALKGSDGIVVAADSRGTFGDPRGVTAQNDAQKKLYVTSKYTAILTAGSGELGASVMLQVPGVIKGVEGITAVMNAVRTLVKTSYKDWFPQFAIQPVPGVPAPVRPDLALMFAGYDVDAQGQAHEPRIYQLVSPTDFAPMLHNYGFALAGVGQYALYILNRLYDSNSPPTVEQLKPLAAYVITETASQDGKVGGPVQMATIAPSDGSKELSQADVDQIIDGNERRRAGLKDSFFKQ